MCGWRLAEMSGEKIEYGISLFESNHRDGDLVKEHHHDVHQLLYAVGGEGEIIINGTASTFTLNRVAIITPFTPHSIISNSKLTVLILAFDQTLLGSPEIDELITRYLTVTQLTDLNPLDGGSFRQQLRKMLYEQSNGDALKLTAMKIYLAQLLLKLVRYQDQAEVTNANSLRAVRLRNYIDHHYFEEISAVDLAAKLQISTRHLNTIFKESFQITPMQYLAKVRIDLAKKLLIETDNDISSICFEVGFESLSTFYRAFKNLAGMSPNKYRSVYPEHLSFTSDF
jgi:AraC-like DNA-binding protein